MASRLETFWYRDSSCDFERNSIILGLKKVSVGVSQKSLSISLDEISGLVNKVIIILIEVHTIVTSVTRWEETDRKRQQRRAR